MTDHSAKRKAVLDAAAGGLTSLQLAERYVLIGPSFASFSYEEQMSQIVKETAEFFRVTPRSTQLCGSAKLGFSLTKNKIFEPGISDLDIAILDASCFARYLEDVADKTNDLQERTLFKDDAAIRRYKSLLSRGIIRSDVLPAIRAKAEWDMFFNKLSARHSATFSKISAAIYLSDSSFVRKQAPAFDTLISEAGTR